ncbi:unnamed protein product [Jaminaea pallidilutea]
MTTKTRRSSASHASQHSLGPSRKSSERQAHRPTAVRARHIVQDQCAKLVHVLIAVIAGLPTTQDDTILIRRHLNVLQETLVTYGCACPTIQHHGTSIKWPNLLKNRLFAAFEEGRWNSWSSWTSWTSWHIQRARRRIVSTSSGRPFHRDWSTSSISLA